MEETKLEGVRPGYRAEITPLGSNKVLKGTVDSVAAGVTNASSTRDDKGMATIDSNLEWVRLAQRVPVRIRLDNQQENIWPAGTTATVVVTGKQDRDESQDSFFRKMAHENIWPAGTTATVVVTGKQDRDESQDSFFRKMAHRLREFG